MRFYRILYIFLAMLATAAAVAMVMYAWHISVVKKLKNEQSFYAKNLNRQEKVIDNLKTRIAILEEELTGSPDSLPGNLLKVYAHKSPSDIGSVGFCLWVPDEYTINQKLKLIISVLMKDSFKKGLIELRRIEQRGNKKVAIIDLRETKEFPSAWKSGYFQGSSGGWSTTYILTNTFLQPHYTGDWIDGVEFWYEGKPIDQNEWDHIFLSGTKYRK